MDRHLKETLIDIIEISKDMRIRGQSDIEMFERWDDDSYFIVLPNTFYKTFSEY